MTTPVVVGDRLRLHAPDGRSLDWSLDWLRAHCPCRECLTESGQRLRSRIGPANLKTVHAEAGELVLGWDDGHVSRHQLVALCRAAEARGTLVPFGMRSRAPLTLARRAFPMETPQQDVEAWLELLDGNHVLLLEGVPPEPRWVTRVGELLAPVVSTIYGRSWLVTAEAQAVNIAYSALSLPLHQDLSAYEAPPGIQLLHCLRFDDDVAGGTSTFADALAAAEALRVSDPSAFRTLCEVWASFQKLNARQAMSIRKPHLVLDDFGNITQVNWAPPFEGPYEGPPEREREYRAAYAAFEAALDALPLLELRLRPGELVLFLNRRTLHGRAAFTPNSTERGGRVLEGCYLSLDDVANHLARLRRARLEK